MKTLGNSIRRYGPLGIALLMLTLSVAVPVLGRADVFTEPVVESEHNPAECPSGHDHTICTQVGANFSAVSRGQAQQVTRTVVRIPLPTQATRVAERAIEEGHPSRAPPLA